MSITSLIFLMVFFCICCFAIAAASFAPWVPTWKKDLPRILKLADLKSGQKFYELGSGTGKVSLYISKHSSAQIIGLEIALPLYLFCKAKQFIAGKNNLVFRWKNLYKQNLSDADVIYFFGTPKPLAKRLKQKLEKELKHGAKVISYVFPIEGWDPKVIDKPSPNDVDIFLYEIY